ncbi:hypothetical protein HYDPIDRAFT_33344 [Hydnomerulius pinastri MD-312]|uniref:F-box domain-containing protein n=1 Tax=Hydnomerulius pinastri MD-312 TaxID=994086 RepID=A0A0C9V219_9AGAM|nr:hypothetical protein HYDPIDRAFT_33344 [Hydnomerulius pinastri MD-312]
MPLSCIGQCSTLVDVDDLDSRKVHSKDVVPSLGHVKRAKQQKQDLLKRPRIPPCLLLIEIITLIFEYVRQWDEYPPDDIEVKWDRTMGKKTLASLARTCKAFHEPALDVLWMKLDSLDPLIKLLPKRMWAKKYYPLMVRMFMREKHWVTFSKYAKRVKSVSGPCWQLSSSVQHNAISALTKSPHASLPLLPSLTELVWSELKMSNLIDPSVSLLQYFVGPKVTKVSLMLVCWPYHVPPEQAVLSKLWELCPDVTSFTAYFPRSSHNDPSQEVGAIVDHWPKLRTLQSCALPQSVMDTLASRRLLESLSIELNNCKPPLYVGKLPESLHNFSLGGNSAPLCTRYLESVHGSPRICGLRVGADDSTLEDIGGLIRALPIHLDKTALHDLKIELNSSYWAVAASETFPLDLPLITPLLAFRALRALDLDVFSAAGLDDMAYKAMAKAWPELREFKLGTVDVSNAIPKASVGAIVSLLTHCPFLETLHIAIDGTIPLPPASPPPYSGDDEDESAQSQGEESWGVSNILITELHVGHSPIDDINVIASCFGALMPRLRKIVTGNVNILYELQPVQGERWERVQAMLVGHLRSRGVSTE